MTPNIDWTSSLAPKHRAMVTAMASHLMLRYRHALLARRAQLQS